MGRLKKHRSLNDRVKACRELKLKNSTNKTFCSVCNDYIHCNGDVEHALLQHKRSSKRHKELVNPKNSNHPLVVINVEESFDEIENELKPCDVSNKSSSFIEPANLHVCFQRNDMYMRIEHGLDQLEVDPLEHLDMDGPFVNMEAKPDESEYLLMNTSLTYGKKTLYELLESPILNIQEKLLKGFNNIVQGKSPYEFSKIKGREVDWVTALEITSDFIDSNESILRGDRRLKTTRRALKRETNKSARLPKRISTLPTSWIL